MKIRLPVPDRSVYPLKQILPAMLLLLLTVNPHEAKATVSSFRIFHSTTDTIHSVSVKKLHSTKNYRVRLFPDATRKALFFYASGRTQRIYQLYVFDMDGKLVNRVNIRNRETTVLNNFTKGNFFFEVFSDDERIENGKIEIN
jgi:hypothetical protein